ncbi:hypothetical protein Y032_0371g137 [Ancylostoma ceylanicum]|uniref:Uncharacterized protein n=1 Tax=Ancylostoma ceylanicum TaxID=53326 RepID=A0A016RU74_9BILA|nr:hypothetical protein Y032_0371g137 [Ancylostoma ceylanicum]
MDQKMELKIITLAKKETNQELASKMAILEQWCTNLEFANTDSFLNCLYSAFIPSLQVKIELNFHTIEY